jgi:distribution and morphology protein 31
MTSHIGHRLYATFRQGPFFLRDIRTNLVSNVSKSHNNLSGFSTRNYHANTASRSTRRLSQKFASGSFLVLGLSPSSTAAVETGANCAVASEKIASSGIPCCYQRPLLGGISRQLWKRGVHTSGNDVKVRKSANSDSHRPETAPTRSRDTLPSESKDAPKINSETSSLNRNLRERLPNLHQFHRPTKEELLAAATGFWSRLRVRFKWFSIRSVRPFNLDEIGTLFSWVLLGHVLWIILGTTTFFSLLIFAINTVFAQGMVDLPNFTAHSY